MLIYYERKILLISTSEQDECLPPATANCGKGRGNFAADMAN
jgi:hypothetical protein